MRIVIDDWIHGTRDRHHRFRVTASDKEGRVIEILETNSRWLVFKFWFRNFFEIGEVKPMGEDWGEEKLINWDEDQ